MIQDLNDQNSVHEDQIIEEISEQNLEHVAGGFCIGCEVVAREAHKEVARSLAQWMHTGTADAVNKMSDAHKLVQKATNDSSATDPRVIRSCSNCEANQSALANLRGGSPSRGSR